MPVQGSSVVTEENVLSTKSEEQEQLMSQDLEEWVESRRLNWTRELR